MLLQVILEGIGLGVLLISVCAIGIRKGAVGMVHCYADNNALIGAGIDTAESTELKEYSWLYEGFSESYYELYNILKLPPAHEAAVQQHDAFSLRFSEMLYLHFYTPRIS